MIRKKETARDYITLTDTAVSWSMCDNLKALVDYLNEPAETGPIARNKAVKVSVALNNLLKDLEL